MGYDRPEQVSASGNLLPVRTQVMHSSIVTSHPEPAEHHSTQLMDMGSHLRFHPGESETLC